MMDRTTKLRWRRRFKRSQKHVENFGQQAEESLDKHFFQRFGRLISVQRFVVTWVLLVVLLVIGVVLQNRVLSGYYQTVKPTDGGTFREGVIGRFSTANPLYATSSVDSSVARLVFSSLMKYDSNNRLVGDLAESIEPDERGSQYTVTLKEGLQWQDGQPLTADDVIFTYQTIQNPDARSPLRSNWQGMRVEKKDARTIVFTLPHALTAFPHSLTNGIVPKHLLSNIPLAQLRSIPFNTVSPVGSGPFRWENVEVKGQTPESREEQIGLIAYDQYHEGRPRLDRFIIRALHEENRGLDALKNQEISAVAGLNTLPDTLINNTSITEYSIPLSGEVLVFLKTTQPILQDVKVREAIARATDTNEIIRGLGYPVIAARGPLLKSHIGYAEDTEQYTQNIEYANQLLEEAGWVMGANGIRHKGEQSLSFRLYSQSTSEYAYVTQILQRQWRAVGIDAQVILQSDEDLQTTIAFHTYDALLYGITLGDDPDVYAYWHSSQADPRSDNRLNFSEFNSADADAALEAGRTRSDPGLRALKYRPFLEAWRSEVPAIALYQPRFLYVTRDKIYGFEPHTFNTAVDRYANVVNWRIRTEITNIE